MPVSVVRTAVQERLWGKAKKQAAAQGHAHDWAYVMGIYKRMLGEPVNKAMLGVPQFAGWRQWGGLPRGVRDEHAELAQAEAADAYRLATTPPSLEAARRASAPPVLTAQAVVDNLGLDLAVSQRLSRLVDGLSSGKSNEVVFRQAWLAHLLDGETDLDPVVRQQLEQRGLALWRSRAEDRRVAMAGQPELTVPTRKLEKAVLYIGPRGGRWANPEHTISWDDKIHGKPKIILTDKTEEDPPPPSASPVETVLTEEERTALEAVAGNPGGVLLTERYQAGPGGRKVTVKVTTGRASAAGLGKLFSRGLLELKSTPEGTGYVLTEAGQKLRQPALAPTVPAKDAPAAEELQEARRMGAAAFMSGRQASPSQDPDVIPKLVRGNSPKKVNALLDAWMQGWSEANVAEPTSAPQPQGVPLLPVSDPSRVDRAAQVRSILEGAENQLAHEGKPAQPVSVVEVARLAGETAAWARSLLGQLVAEGKMIEWPDGFTWVRPQPVTVPVGKPLPQGKRTEMGAVGEIANQSVTHVVSTPAGAKRQGFFLVGRYPAELGYERDDGTPLTEEEAKQISEVGPGPHHRTRIWPTAEAARQAVEAAGGQVVTMPPVKQSEPGWERMPEDESKPAASPPAVTVPVAPVSPPAVVVGGRAAGKSTKAAQADLFSAATTARSPAPPAPPAPAPSVPRPAVTVPAGARKGSGKGSRKDLAVEQGEHVWGSRADLAGIRPTVADLRDMNPAQQAKLVTKANLLPESDPEALLAGGVHPGGIILRKTLEGLVSSKAADTQESREAYMEGVGFLTTSLERCKTAEDVREFVQDWHYLAAGQVQGKTYSAAELAAAHQEYLTAHGLTVMLTREQIFKARREVDTLQEQARVLEGARYQQEKEARKRRQPPPPPISDNPKWNELRVKWLAVAKLIEEAQKALPSDRDVLTWKEHAVKYDIGLVRRANGSVATFTTSLGKTEETTRYKAMAKALGDRIDRLVLTSGGRMYSNRGVLEAPKLWRDAHAAVKAMEQDTLEIQVQKMRKAVGDTSRKTPSVGRGERFRWERDVPGEINRVGGRPVGAADPVKLAADFGFPNVQFGNWVTDDDADTHLRGAHGALFDLADLLGAELRQLSFNGRLSLGFGARGSGDAVAHYEPTEVIINLTKIAGGGSLAHEWGHALDHLVSMLAHDERNSGQLLSAGFMQDVDPRVAQAFDKVMTLMRWGPAGMVRWEQEKQLAQLNREAKIRDLGYGERRIRSQLRRTLAKAKPSEYQEHAAVLGGDLRTTEEMFARSFEAWAEDVLVEQGRVSSYLVSGTRKVYSTGKYTASGVEAQYYPQGAERKAINAAMGELVTTIRETGTLKKALEQLDGDGMSGCQRAMLARRLFYSDEPRLTVPVDRLRKAGGPFIGPKGGKWADSKHTQHWEEPGSDGQQMGLFVPAGKGKPEVLPRPKELLKQKIGTTIETTDAAAKKLDRNKWEFTFKTRKTPDGKQTVLVGDPAQVYQMFMFEWNAANVPPESPEKLAKRKQAAMKLALRDDPVREPPESKPVLTVPATPASSPSLPPRTLDTMSEAIAMSSPSGRQSKSSQQAAQKRLGEALFGPGGLPAPQVAQPSKVEVLRRQAKELRGLAARGMGPRKNKAAAEKLEAQADELEAVEAGPDSEQFHRAIVRAERELRDWVATLGAGLEKKADQLVAEMDKAPVAEWPRLAGQAEDLYKQAAERWDTGFEGNPAHASSRTLLKLFRGRDIKGNKRPAIREVTNQDILWQMSPAQVERVKDVADAAQRRVQEKRDQLLVRKNAEPKVEQVEDIAHRAIESRHVDERMAVRDKYAGKEVMREIGNQVWTVPHPEQTRLLEEMEPRQAEEHREALAPAAYLKKQEAGAGPEELALLAERSAQHFRRAAEWLEKREKAGAARVRAVAEKFEKLAAGHRQKASSTPAAEKSLRLLVPAGTFRLQKFAVDDGFCKSGVPRGGKYVKRAPRPGGQGYRYYYSAKGYERATGHVDGQQATDRHLGKRVLTLLTKAGPAGLHPRRLADLVRRHGRQRVAGALKSTGCRLVKGRLVARTR